MHAFSATLAADDPKIATDLVARLDGQLNHLDAPEAKKIDAYTKALYRYLHIRQADLHIVSGRLTQQRLQEVLYAMTLGKPLVILDGPSFTGDVSAFAKAAVMSRLSKTYLSTITMLDDTELNTFLKNIAQPVNYVITKHEQILIRSQINGHLRGLLTPSA